MENILLQNVTILDKQSEHNGQVMDVLIIDGLISEIAAKIHPNNNIQTINGEGQYLAPGFFDLNANFGEPGLETKESLESGCLTAMAGGFTGLALMPNTEPPIHSKAEVLYIVNKTKDNLVDVFPLGTLSQNREGKDLAELYDMKQAGAIAFTDGNRSVSDAGLMSRALLYSKGFDGLIFSFSEDPTLAGKGKMNEGVMSTLLGMKGNPALAEELMIARDLYLAEYNGARIHFSTISSAGSVELIRKARQKGQEVSCDVALHHLVFSEEELHDFNSQYKVKPPLRTRKDMEALLAGLQDGTIDAIVTQHTPHELEFKNVEFEIASYGMIALQTALPMALKAGLSAEQVVEKMSVNPRKILNLPLPQIKAGTKANLVLFDTRTEWVFDAENNRSLSENSPLMGQTLKGKVSLVYNNNKYLLSNNNKR